MVGLQNLEINIVKIHALKIAAGFDEEREGLNIGCARGSRCSSGIEEKPLAGLAGLIHGPRRLRRKGIACGLNRTQIIPQNIEERNLNEAECRAKKWNRSHPVARHLPFGARCRRELLEGPRGIVGARD